MKRFQIVHVNCDCSSDIIAVLPSQINTWTYGPRCRGCGKIMGCMQWTTHPKDEQVKANTGEEAVMMYHRKRAEEKVRDGDVTEPTKEDVAFSCCGGIDAHRNDISQTPCSATDILLAAILLGRFSPLAPHHVGAIRERLRELNDNELREMVATGKWPNEEVTL